MEAFINYIYKAALLVIGVISVILTGLFLLSGLFFTCYSPDMVSQEVFTRTDNLLLTLPLTVLFFLAAGGIVHLACHKQKTGRTLSSRRTDMKRQNTGHEPATGKRLLLCLTLAWCVLLGAALILFGRTLPAADSASVYSIAESLASGNMGVIHPTDSYLSYYPQQIGLAAYYEGIIRLWKLVFGEIPAHHFLKCLNILFACAIIFYTSRCVDLMFEDDRVTCFYLALTFGNMPLFFYTSFIYGELPSFGLYCAGLYFLLLILKRGPLIAMPVKTACLGALSLILFTGSVMLRKNSLILIIAVLLVLFLQWLKTRRHSLLLLAILCLVCTVSILPIVRLLYERRADNTLQDGVPAISYLAMGMQESSRGNGWYNGFNFNTYQASGMDSEQTALESRQAIRERLTFFRERPGYMMSFYKDKFLSQWADGTYACRQATLASWGRSAFLEEIYDGKFSSLFVGYCNILQNLLYLGAFLFSLAACKRKGSLCAIPGLPLYLGLIGVTGGFLFHMFWEANSRYILPYGLLLMPCAAWGLAWLWERTPFRKTQICRQEE